MKRQGIKAAYTLAAWYRIEALCETPLRVGGTENDPNAILRDSEGCPLVQGSSLAGALREWLEKDSGEKTAADLFGTAAADGQISPGQMRVSDGTFAQQMKTLSRPRLKLDAKTRTAKNGQKFDMAHIPTGTRFSFDLYWLGTAGQTEDTDTWTEKIKTVEHMLSALHSGEIRLGAQKSSGFGRVSLQYRKRLYTLSNERDRRDWLEKTPPDGLPVTPERLTHGQWVCFTLRFHADSLLVKAGTEAVTEAGEDGFTMVTAQMEEAGCPVIPGSSVKGAVRARVEQIAAFMGLPAGQTEALFGCMGGNGTGTAGKVRFDDIRLPAENRSIIRRIRINRFTGGVIRSGLFKEEAAATGADAAELRVSVPAEQETGCALLLYALRDLAWNLYSLGSGRSVGRGNLRAEELEIRLPEGSTVLYRFQDNFRCQVEGASKAVTGWLEALESLAAKGANPA